MIHRWRGTRHNAATLAASLRVQWPAGRTAADAARLLTHPLLGLPRNYQINPQDGAAVALTDTTLGRPDSRRGLLLRTEPAPTAADDERARSDAAVAPSPAWCRWSADARPERGRR